MAGKVTRTVQSNNPVDIFKQNDNTSLIAMGTNVSNGNFFLSKGNTGNENNLLTITPSGNFTFSNGDASGAGATGTTVNYTDLAKIDGITDGTAAANKALVLDSSNNIAGINHITMSGDLKTSSTNVNIFNESNIGQLNIGTGATGIKIGGGATHIDIATDSGTSTTFNIGANDDTVNIYGSLNVHGTTNTVHSTNTYLYDPVFELSKGQTGTPITDSGLLINRGYGTGGGQENGFIGFDESADSFVMGLTQNDSGHTGNYTITPGTLQLTKLIGEDTNNTLTLDETNVYINASTVGITGTTTINGELTANQLNLTNSAHIAPTGSNHIQVNTLGNTGTIYLNGDVTVLGSLSTTTSSSKQTIGDTTNSTSTSTGALIVNGGAGIAKDVYIGGLLDVDDTINVGGTGTFSHMNVNGNVGITGGNLTLYGTSTQVGNAALTGDADVTGNVGITGGNLTLHGTSTQVGNAALTGSFTQIGDADVTGNVGITGGNLTLYGTSTQVGNATLTGDADVTGNVGITGGNLTLYGTSTQVGNATLTGSFTQTGDADVTGNVGITGGNLDIYGNVGVTGSQFTVDVANTANDSIQLVSTGGIILTAGTNRTVDINDLTTTSFTTSSDKRYKENIETIPSSLEKVLGLRGVYYDWIDKKKFNERKQVGFIAQEVEEVVPELVVTNDEGFKSVNYNQSVSLLVEAIKEQQSMIKQLQEEIYLIKNKPKRKYTKKKKDESI